MRSIFATHSAIVAFVVALLGPVSPANSHPSSGIVVDEQGQVFFSDLSRGVVKIGTDGETTVLSKEGQHWLALDSHGSFSRVRFDQSPHWPRWFKRRTAMGARPAIIGDGGSPLAIGRDGNLYYVCNPEHLIPGGLLIAKLTPDGKESLLNAAFRRESDELGGIKGLAIGPDDSLYAAFPKAVLKFSLDGTGTTVLNPVVVVDCEKQPPPGADAPPSLRGLAVDANGIVYVAATGCRCIIKIARDGAVETVLRAESPWSPTGVALARGEIFALEYNVIDDAAHDYLPRIRKLTNDGNVKTLVTFSEAAP
jgi:SMP-30/Gluconolactonase/LRE-like region